MYILTKLLNWIKLNTECDKFIGYRVKSCWVQPTSNSLISSNNLIRKSPNLVVQSSHFFIFYFFFWNFILNNHHLEATLVKSSEKYCNIITQKENLIIPRNITWVSYAGYKSHPIIEKSQEVNQHNTAVNKIVMETAFINHDNKLEKLIFKKSFVHIPIVRKADQLYKLQQGCSASPVMTSMFLVPSQPIHVLCNASNKNTRTLTNQNVEGWLCKANTQTHILRKPS